MKASERRGAARESQSSIRRSKVARIAVPHLSYPLLRQQVFLVESPFRNRLTLSVGVFPGVNSVTVMIGLATTFLVAPLEVAVAAGKTFVDALPPAPAAVEVCFFIP